jgi:hypothetical protein
MDRICILKTSIEIFASIHLGMKSTPCCMNAASAKNSVFKIENLFDSCGVVSSSMLHSYGEKRETRKRITLTPIYANVTHIQISFDNGAMNENTPEINNNNEPYLNDEYATIRRTCLLHLVSFFLVY